GNDTIDMRALSATSLATLASAGTPWVGVLSGGPGRDILRGSNGPDRIDGGAGSDTLFGFGGNDRIWGDTGQGSSSADVDTLYGGAGDDDLFGGAGSNILMSWSDTPFDSKGVFRGLDTAGNLMDYAADGTALRAFEDTGLNRMVGSAVRADTLYGGTGLDFMDGAGGGDVLYTRKGVTFEASDGFGADDSWKQYARNSNRVWYLSGTEGDDTVRIDYVTNPYNPLFGRHLVAFSTAGVFDPRFNGFDSFSAFDRNNNAIHARVDSVVDTASMLADPATGQPRPPEEISLARIPDGVTATDIVNKLLGAEPDFLAIIIDARAGNDTVSVGETVRTSVWVDGGAGDDTVTIAPSRAFLPDITDPRTARNDTLQAARDLGVLATSVAFTGLTIDSNRPESPDVDWYKVRFAQAPVTGDRVRLVPSDEISKLALRLELFTADGKSTGFTSILSGDRPAVPATGSLAGLAAGTDYFLKVSSDGAIPSGYEIRFDLAAGADTAEPNDAFDRATRIGEITRPVSLEGLTLHSSGDTDWFSFSVARQPSLGDRLVLDAANASAKASMTIYQAGQTSGSIGAEIATGITSFNLSSLANGNYLVKVIATAPTRHALNFTSDAAPLPQNNTNTLVLPNPTLMYPVNNS
ncbi:MAG: calcium-binding protein, partial [Planctomycetota bacterium]